MLDGESSPRTGPDPGQFLGSDEVVRSAHPAIVSVARESRASSHSDEDFAERACVWVRDEIRHTVDAQDRRVTLSASEEQVPALPISRLSEADAGEILTLQRAAYVTEAAAHDDLGLPALTQTLDDLQNELRDPALTALGIRLDGRLIGAVRLRRPADVVELGRLIVAPDRQGEGIGTRLLGVSEAACADAREIRLFTGERSVANIRLYTRLGYRETARTPAGGYRLVHLTKHLVAGSVAASVAAGPDDGAEA